MKSFVKGVEVSGGCLEGGNDVIAPDVALSHHGCHIGVCVLQS